MVDPEPLRPHLPFFFMRKKEHSMVHGMYLVDVGDIEERKKIKVGAMKGKANTSIFILELLM